MISEKEREIIKIEILILEIKIAQDKGSKNNATSLFQKKIEEFDLSKQLELNRLMAAINISGILPEQKAMRDYIGKILVACDKELIDVDPRDLDLHF